MKKPPQDKASLGNSPAAWALQDRSAVDVATAQPVESRAQAVDSDVQHLLAQFSECLRDEPDIDQEGRNYLQQQFADALKGAKSAQDPGDAGSADWRQLVEVLRSTEGLDEDEANALIRQMDQMMQPLKRPAVSLAMEYSRRCRADGEESARDWYKRQTLQDPEKDPPPVPGFTRRPLPKDSVTLSRSRRLRGPPND